MLVQCLNLHFSQAAGAEQQPCSELCVLAGPPEKTRKGKMLLKTECLEDFRDRSEQFGLKTHSRGKFSIYQTGFPAQFLEESTLCCITAWAVEWLWPRRGTSPAAADSDRHWTHISLPAGAGPKILRVCQLHLMLCCRRRLHWEYSYWSKFNNDLFFSHPVFTFAEKFFIIDENWRLPYYHMLPFFS